MMPRKIARTKHHAAEQVDQALRCNRFSLMMTTKTPRRIRAKPMTKPNYAIIRPAPQS
jgi:hypothetical protein